MDINRIIYGTPYKRILAGYNAIKENYNEEEAKKFYEVYSKESLSDILENSRMIFSESYFGLDFYKDIVLNPSSCIFTELENEYDKVNEFVSENADNMPSNQKDIYTAFREEFKNYIESVDDIILISSYLKSGENENFEKGLSDIIYKEKTSGSPDIDNIAKYLSENADLRTTITYVPFIYNLFDMGGAISSVVKEKTSELTSDNSWSTFVLNSVIMNKLSESSIYTESVNTNIYNPAVKAIFMGLMLSDIEGNIDRMRSTSVKDSNIVFHESSHAAIENLYLDKIESELFADEINARKKEINNYIKEATSAYYDLLSFEYSRSDSDKKCSGYSFLRGDDSITLEKAYTEISSKYADLVTESDDHFFEKSGDDNKNADVNDEDIDSQIDELSKDEDNEQTTYTSGKSASTSSRINPPKTGNLANRIQTKAQDNNLKMLGKAGKLKKLGQDVGNAAKAVLKMPIAFVNGLKAEVHKLDTMDDERRKNYITAPGYRKSILKKLKLAILYGGAIECNLALVPVIMTYRHFSKIKDKRMKNEAISDLEAEIKVCDAKIEDAQQSDDKQQRYQLIRIREKLNRELIRVTTNSKYI